jgi:hypothetical protein
VYYKEREGTKEEETIGMHHLYSMAIARQSERLIYQNWGRLLFNPNQSLSNVAN